MSFENWLQIISKNKNKLILSTIILVFAVTIYLVSGDYLTDHWNYAKVSDLILDHFGPYNLSFLFVWFFILVIAIFFAYPLFFNPNELPYVMNMFSLFVITRAVFVMFTHLGIPADAINPVFPWFLQSLGFSNDLFFSGHTGLPFLGFLIFKKNNFIKYFMFFSSIILGITVLLMHIHYSIDVFSAFFITYGIYNIGNLFLINNS